jgi:hypothetical protein
MKSLLAALILLVAYTTASFAYCPPVCGEGLGTRGGALRERLQEYREWRDLMRQEQQGQRDRSSESRPAPLRVSAARYNAHRLLLERRFDEAIAILSDAFQHVERGSERQLSLYGDWHVAWATKFWSMGNYLRALEEAEKSISDLEHVTGFSVGLFYAVSGQGQLFENRKRWVEYLKSEYARKGHEIEECIREGQKGCSRARDRCLAQKKTKEERDDCTRAYGLCREQVIAGCRK